MVLFVFVIMLLNAGVEERGHGTTVAIGLGIPGVVVLAGILIYALTARNPAAKPVAIGALYGPPAEIGRLLFREFLLPFEVTSVLILIAIMTLCPSRASARSDRWDYCMIVQLCFAEARGRLGVVACQRAPFWKGASSNVAAVVMVVSVAKAFSSRSSSTSSALYVTSAPRSQSVSAPRGAR